MLKTIGDEIAKFLTSYWLSVGWVFRTFLFLCLMLSLFVAARVGLVGVEAQRLTRHLIPVQLTLIDSAQAPGFIVVQSDISTPNGWKGLIPGSACYSGDQIRFNAESSATGWVAMFGLSANGRYPLLEGGLDPVAVDAGANLLGGVRLDNEIGLEIFGFVFSPTPLELDKVLEISLTHDDLTKMLSNSKGGTRLSAFPSLPKGMSGHTSYCLHRT